MLKKIIIFLYILVLIVTPNILAVTHVEPAKMIVKTEPGQRQTGLIKVTNKGEEEIELKAILYDWELKDDDSLNALEAGSNEYTLDGLIKFNPKIFKLAPGKTQVVRFTITAPDNIEKERRGIVFFEEETNLIDQATGARVITQVGTAIYFVPTTSYSKFELLGSKIYNPADNNELSRCLLLFQNTGNTTLRYIISYLVINENGALIDKREYNEKIILPSYKRVLGFNFGQKFESGNYKMKLTIDFFGTDKNGEYTIPFKIE